MELAKKTRRLLTIAVTSSALLWPWGAESGTSAATNISAAVGPNYIILKWPNGGSIRTLKAGTYAILVRDRTPSGNFHLIGFPAGGTSLIANRKTGIRYRGRATWTMSLRKGNYRYYSDTHPGAIHQFRVQ
jgi:hypothetical protein